MFKQYVELSGDFKDVGKKVDRQVIWDEKQKGWLVARMSKKGFSNVKVTDEPVAEWYVSALCCSIASSVAT